MTVTPITLDDLTAATLDGAGVFDVLMRTNKLHLDAQFKDGRLKGPEYAQVYLGSLEQVLQASLQFLLEKDKVTLAAQLLEKQIALAEVELQTAQANLAIAEASLAKVPAEIALLEQQKTNLEAEALNIPKQGLMIDAQKAHVVQQTTNLVNEDLLTTSKIALADQQKLNAVVEGEVLTATKCKLQAEFDVLMETKLKTAQETSLLTWKVTTEKAQTIALGVDDNSVVGKQKILYGAQADGFKRDAEQKAAKIMVDSWNVRRTTDEGTVADATNKLSDTYVGQAVQKLLTGVGA